jgi:hypothetical protein
MLMNGCREPSKIILINGASSAGKSTLARSLQQKLHEPFLHLSFDHLRESNALPMARIRNGELDWARMRLPSLTDSIAVCQPSPRPATTSCGTDIGFTEITAPAHKGNTEPKATAS